MTYDITQADILDWAAAYDGPLTSFGALYLRIGAAMTRIAERSKVQQVIRFFVAFNPKQTKRADVVNGLPRTSTFLASIVISLQCFAALGLPVWAAIAAASVNILRVIQSVAMCITAGTRAIFATTLACFQNTFILPKLFAAVKTSERYRIGFRRTRLDGSILTSGRTVFPAPIFSARFGTLKRSAALFTYQINAGDWGNISRGLAFLSLPHTRN